MSSTRTFLPPGESTEEISTTTKTQVFLEEDFPLPENDIQVKKTPSRKRRRRSSFSSPLNSRDLEKVLNTPTKRARAIFEKLDRGVELSERRISKELGASLSAFVTRGETESLEIALSEGADPNWNSPVTALYAAVDLKRVDYCKLLLAHGASIVKKNSANEGRPITLAMQRPGSKVYNLFIEHISAIERDYSPSTDDSTNGNDIGNTTPLRSNVTEDNGEPPRKKAKHF